MKKILLPILFLACIFSIKAQQFKYYLDNSLTFKDINGTAIPFPFTGGLVSPQFSNIDLNFDGKKDLFVFDKGANKVLTFICNGPAGSADWVYAPQYESAFPPLYNWALLVDYNCDGLEDVFSMADPSKYGAAMKVLKNVSTGGKLKFELAAEPLMTQSYDTTMMDQEVYSFIDDIPAITDVDNDGDVDIVTFDVLGSFANMFRNNRVEKGYHCDSLNFRFVDFCWGSWLESSTSRDITLGINCDYFGGKYYKSGSTNAAHQGSTMLLLDMDNDNDKDLILGDVSFDQVILLHNDKKEKSWPYDTISAFDTVFPRNTKALSIYTFPATFFVDINNDGKRDLAGAPNLKDGGKTLNQVWYYVNNGTDKQPVFAHVKDNFLQDQTIDFGSGASVTLADVDADGDTDIVVGNRGDFTVTKNTDDRLALFRNTGTKSNPVFKLDDVDFLGLAGDSIRDAKPTFGDLNGDGKTDMLIGDQDGILRYYEASGQFTFNPPIKKYASIDIGFGAAPQLFDLDKDGLLDIIIGSGGGFINYYKNKGSKTAPSFDSVPTMDTLGGVFVNGFFWGNYVYDANFNIIDSSKVYDFTGYATPFFTDLDENGKTDLLVGCETGKLWLFKDITDISSNFTEEEKFVFNNNSGAFSGIDFGRRIVPVSVKLYDTAKPVIVMGNFRGGINYLRADNGKPTGIAPVPDVALKPLNISVFPNPASETATLLRDLQQSAATLTISVNDVLGREVYRSTWEGSNANHQLWLNGYKSGIYYISVTDGKQYQGFEKLTVVR